MSFKMIKYVLFGLLFSFVLGCGTEGDGDPGNKNKLPVSWYSGFKMTDLLEQEVKVTSVSDIASLLNAKWYAEFTVINPAKLSGKKYILSSCRPLLDMGGMELNTLRERDNAAFMEVSVMCEATNKIASGKPAEQTNLSNIIFDSTLPDVLPKQVAMVISISESNKMLKNDNIKNWAQFEKIIDVESRSPNHAIYKFKGGEQELELVAKGDFNDDGIEDVMITSRDSVTGGSYSAIRLFTLTRYKKDGSLELIGSTPSE